MNTMDLGTESETPPAQFWIVYGIGFGVMTRQHRTRDRATTEARRLAQDNPGVMFVVLESVETFSAVRPAKPPPSPFMDGLPRPPSPKPPKPPRPLRWPMPWFWGRP